VRPSLQSVILETAKATTAPALAQRLAGGMAGPSIVLARIWLNTADGLHLAGSAGTPTGGGSYTRLDGGFSHLAIGQGKIGHIAATRSPHVIPSLRGDEDWLANPDWIARQGVRAFAGYPILSNGDLLGVMAIFDRARPSDEDLAEWEFLARYVATRLIDLRERDALLARVDTRAGSDTDGVAPQTAIVPPRTILTRGELRVIERDTLEAALAQTSGHVFGSRGAAILLGMKPTTLASRMKALGIPPARAIRRATKIRMLEASEGSSSD
jgi:GAF domain-containing protein